MTQHRGRFKATDRHDRMVFEVTCDAKGLYYLNDVKVVPCKTSDSGVLGQRKFPFNNMDDKILVSTFFDMAENPSQQVGKVNLLPLEHTCRCDPQETQRCPHTSLLTVCAHASLALNACTPLVLAYTREVRI